MGSFDISRINFNPAKHYSSVRMQQGRVLVDDDFNENERIATEDHRRALVDIIGGFGSPDNGFSIEPLLPGGGIHDAGNINFRIKAGSIYLGGLRLDLEQDETFQLQKDWLQKAANADPAPVGLNSERYDLVYLEAWQQPVCAVEDASLFEPALGGVDTTTRIRLMRRVKIASDIGFCDCVEAWRQLVSIWQSQGQGTLQPWHERQVNATLTVGYVDDTLPEDLCTPTAASGYLGAENQAIRVQLVDANHFTWGFDNASPYYRVLVSANGKTVTMLTDPKDVHHWPLSRQVVEILPWSAVLPNGEKIADISGHLSKVEASYNPDTHEFTLLSALPAGFGSEWKSRADRADLENQDPAEYFYLRIWNRGGDLLSPPSVSFAPGNPVVLGNTGLTITLSGTEFVSGDYWVIGARPETPDQVTPWELEKGILPHGYRRFLAPIAILKWPAAEREPTGEIIHDCRKKFTPLTEPDCCCTYTVGDGVRSRGDYQSIQEAVNNLPASGGKICVLPGEHFANVGIVDRRQITIHGCGDHSIIRPLPNKTKEPVFYIGNSQKIKISELTIVSMDGIGIAVKDRPGFKRSSEQITIEHNRMIAAIHAILVDTDANKSGNNNIQILYNQIGMLDKEEGKPAIFSLADDVLIERNRIVVIPAPDEDEDDPRDPNDSDDPFNPCIRARLNTDRGISFTYQIFVLFQYVRLYKAFGRYKRTYKTWGGIQIAGGSEKVWILENEIIGGRGNGITLGHFSAETMHEQLTGASFMHANEDYQVQGVYDIQIEGNRIFQMGLSGISSVEMNTKAKVFVHLEDVGIYRNRIAYCANHIPAEFEASQAKSKAFGGIALGDVVELRIQENRIEENGTKTMAAVCGIFILNGEQIDISKNSIVQNGVILEDGDDAVDRGNRAGILIRMTFKSSKIISLLSSKQPSFDGVPTAVVHNNIVDQPLGHALFVIAMGPVSVTDNQFTSHGTDRKNPFSFLASTVMIFNLGISKDMVLMSFAGLAKKAELTGSYKQDKKEFMQFALMMQWLPNGKTIFSGNQSTLDMRFASVTMALSSQMIVSLDDVGFLGNQLECAALLGIVEGQFTADIVLLDTLIFGASARSNDNRFTDGLTLGMRYSLLQIGILSTAVSNQATHCLWVLGARSAVANNLVLFNDNCPDLKD